MAWWPTYMIFCLLLVKCLTINNIQGGVCLRNNKNQFNIVCKCLVFNLNGWYISASICIGWYLRNLRLFVSDVNISTDISLWFWPLVTAREVKTHTKESELALANGSSITFSFQTCVWFGPHPCHFLSFVGTPTCDLLLPVPIKSCVHNTLPTW